MKIKGSCSQCGGSITKEVEAGDIITLGDGSGMSNGLHHVLWNGWGKDVPFKPVRVLRVEGNMLAVTPLHWEKDAGNREQFDDKVYPALSWIPSRGGSRDVFWIYAPHCHPIESTK